MTSNAIKYRMPLGFAGDVTRAQSSTIEARLIDGTTPPLKYGIPVKLVSGKIQPIASGDAATDIYGWLVRPYPTSGTGSQTGSNVPSTTQACDVMRRGYIAVALTRGTAALGAPAYVRITAGSHAVGDIEDGPDTAACVVCGTFMGPAGDDGIVEIAYNI